MTALVLCAHGTRDPGGRAVVRGVVEDVAAALPGVAVHEAYVDVHAPEVADVVAALPRGDGPAPSGVVVPLLLAAGYHVHVDLADAVRSRPDVVVTGALGPDERLVDLVADRLEAAGVADGTAVVLAPAGSSDVRAQADSVETARLIGRRRAGPVGLGYAAGPAPSVADEVARMRREDAASVAVASYLLAPGFFQRRLADAGADLVTGPLAPDPRIVEIVLDRYRTALRRS